MGKQIQESAIDESFECVTGHQINNENKNALKIYDGFMKIKEYEVSKIFNLKILHRILV